MNSHVSCLSNLFYPSIKQFATFDEEEENNANGSKKKRIAILPPIILTSLAVYLSNRSHLWCDYVKRNFITYDSRYPFLVGDQQYISMFSYQNALDGACYNYDNVQDMYVDSSLRTARAFSLMSTVLGGVLLFLLWLSPCLTFPKGVNTGLCIMLFLNGIIEGFVLLFMSSSMCDGNFGICRWVKDWYFKNVHSTNLSCFY